MENRNDIVTRPTNYLVAILVSLGFLGAGILLIFYIGSQSRQETIRYINEAVEQSRFNVDTHIDEEFQTMGTGIILTEEREWLAEDAAFDRMVRRLLGSNTYTRVGIADARGDALWADREGRTSRGNLAREAYIQKALAGENAISETRWDEDSGLPVNDYAIPVYAVDGTMRGVLFASDPESELRAVVDNSLFANEGFAQIIKRDGTYVVRSDSPLRKAGDRDVFDLPYPANVEMRRQMLGNMTAGRPGHLRTSFGRDRRIGAYAPSKHNDWYVFYGVPEQKVTAGLQSITMGAMGVLVISGVVFLFFILMIWRNNKKNQQKLERLAFVDPVTGGRSLQKFKIDARKLLAELPQADYAVCYGDIKGFKYINDIFGRSAGDELLRHVWQTLTDESREDEINAHASADIFVSLRRFESKEEAEARYAAVEERVAAFPVTANQGYKAEIYGGVYMIDMQDGPLALEDMLDRALEAQQDVKRRPDGSRLGFYTHEMREQKLWETEVESKMERALASGEFKMYLQPQIGIQGGNRITGMEALVRWKPPGQALIPPLRFIPLFERTGFIIHLDRYMVEEACRFYREHAFAATDAPPVLSVNISRLSLLQSDIVQLYTGLKDKYGIPDGCLELEFTEGLLFEDHGRFQRIVEQFRDNGFLCSLDDFGSGYSSLNTLKSLRVDALKLDKLFFAYGGEEARGRELVRMIISLAKFLRIETVAEGIEEEEEVQWLREIGCDVVQGYVFSKPLPADAFMRFLAEWKKT